MGKENGSNGGPQFEQGNGRDVPRCSIGPALEDRIRIYEEVSSI